MKLAEAIEFGQLARKAAAGRHVASQFEGWASLLTAFITDSETDQDDIEE